MKEILCERCQALKLYFALEKSCRERSLFHTHDLLSFAEAMYSASEKSFEHSAACEAYLVCFLRSVDT